LSLNGLLVVEPHPPIEASTGHRAATTTKPILDTFITDLRAAVAATHSNIRT
jgi:hypothetical protein